MKLIVGILLTVFVCTQGAPNTGRVVGGDVAEIGDAPYIVSLRSYGSHSCGGSLISKHWILTAAHCATSSPSSYSIQYGVLNISSSASDDSVIQVSEVIRHSEYSSYSMENDIAVMKLASPAKVRGNVKVAKLPYQDEPAPGGSPALLAGWGRLSTGGIIPTQLQKVNITIVDLEECRKAHYNVLHPSNLCAGVPEGGKGQCNGDSGGPLTYNGKVVGLVSWSVKPCTVRGYPGVYTRVASYRDWIKSTTGV